ncbi:hypothetical protein BST27_23370 [Mycobacterium intermedium]|uniref:Uncharacterized protein n=1 Tax=Mycobacterium intermedium TaxID=28445 RepID=A0A1E3SAC4_MYCIE|nr:hypothetical protein [Mycobacterium intermedium]MCV6966642.1 hypothetical protein [Mycobacterium intermedium]ODQ98592.1 hypothetical protein BHQ20_21105 [Mycobacterium intermedium]OPE46366.1 hypothetical protein BV508_26270 [Mycobacterium intermedium]ORA96986.1 hypothetical protein BST27_23370 [Mycobacterium intermedium]
MTQPNLTVPPNPERAEYLRQFQIAESMPGWKAFVDHQLDVADNGLPQYRAATFTAEVVDKLVAAQLDTIWVLTNMQNGMLQAAESLQGLFYKKKDDGHANSGHQETAAGPLSEFLSTDLRQAKWSGR